MITNINVYGTGEGVLPRFSQISCYTKRGHARSLVRTVVCGSYMLKKIIKLRKSWTARIEDDTMSYSAVLPPQGPTCPQSKIKNLGTIFWKTMQTATKSTQILLFAGLHNKDRCGEYLSSIKISARCNKYRKEHGVVTTGAI